MKANEFVKKFGWDESKRHFNDIREAANQVSHKHSLEEFSEDLGRLLDSRKLVLFYGGISNAKEILRLSALSGYSPSSLRGIADAIADVESCL